MENLFVAKYLCLQIACFQTREGQVEHTPATEAALGDSTSSLPACRSTPWQKARDISWAVRRNPLVALSFTRMMWFVSPKLSSLISHSDFEHVNLGSMQFQTVRDITSDANLWCPKKMAEKTIRYSHF